MQERCAARRRLVFYICLLIRRDRACNWTAWPLACCMCANVGSDFFFCFVFPLALICFESRSACGLAAGTPRPHRMRKTCGMAPRQDGRTARCVEEWRQFGAGVCAAVRRCGRFRRILTPDISGWDIGRGCNAPGSLIHGESLYHLLVHKSPFIVSPRPPLLA